MLTFSIDEGIWNRVWAFTDDGRPLELAKLDVALVPCVYRFSLYFSNYYNSPSAPNRVYPPTSRP